MAPRRVRSLPRTRQGLVWLLPRQRNQGRSGSLAPPVLAGREAAQWRGRENPWGECWSERFPFAAHSHTAKHAPRGFEERARETPLLLPPTSPVAPWNGPTGQNRNTAPEDAEGPYGFS